MSPRQDEYVEEVEFLRSCGIGDVQIVAKLNTSAAALSRGLYRAGRHDLAGPFQAMANQTREPQRRVRTKPCALCGGECNIGATTCRPCWRTKVLPTRPHYQPMQRKAS